MKLRLKGDSIRLRLDQDDLAQFADHGRVEAATPFGKEASLRYVLRASTEVDHLTVHGEEGEVVIHVPAALAEEWAQTDRVSLEARPSIGGERTLHVLVEKDLGCQHRSTAGEEGMFDHLRSGESGQAEA